MPLWKRSDPTTATREQEIKALLAQVRLRDEASQDDVVKAARKLGEYRERRAVKPLIALLLADAGFGYSRQRREAAAKALGQIGDPSAIEPLLRSAPKFNEITETLDALKAISVPRTIKVAITYLRNPSTRWNYSSQIQRVLVACGGEAVEPLVAQLRKKDARAAELACLALWQIGDQQAVPALIDVLKESDSGLVAAAAAALGRLRDTRAAMPLVPILSHSFALTRESAVKALITINDPNVVAPVAELLSSPNIAARVSAARVLVSFPFDQTVSVQTLSALLNNPAVNATDQQAAAEALGDISRLRPEVQQFAHQSLEDALEISRDPRVKRVLAEQLRIKYCEQCGTRGTSREFAQPPFEFCSAECRETFGRKLFALHRDKIMSDVTKSGGAWVTLGPPSYASTPSPQTVIMHCKHCGSQTTVSSKTCPQCSGQLN